MQEVFDAKDSDTNTQIAHRHLRGVTHGCQVSDGFARDETSRNKSSNIMKGIVSSVYAKLPTPAIMHCCSVTTSTFDKSVLSARSFNRAIKYHEILFKVEIFTRTSLQTFASLPDKTLVWRNAYPPATSNAQPPTDVGKANISFTFNRRTEKVNLKAKATVPYRCVEVSQLAGFHLKRCRKCHPCSKHQC